MKYKTIWSWKVMDEIMEGKKVYMLDREAVVAICVSDLSVGCLAQALATEDKTARYEFWIVEEETKNAEL